jgi:RNA polymerase sigma factor (sigma-70 family)
MSTKRVMRPEAAAWRGLEEIRGSLRAFLGRHCSDDNDIEDVIQETFVRAARYRSFCRVHNLRPWARRIALNVLADWRRRASRCPVQPLEALENDLPAGDEEGPGSFQVGRWRVETDTAIAMVHHELPRLRSADRRLLDGYYGDQRTVREAGEAAGVPPRLAKIRLFRARRRLLRALRRRIALERSCSVGG